jgi:hypothetical protein
MKEFKRATHLAPHFAARATLLLCLLAAVLPTAGCFESKVVTSKVNPPASPKHPETMNGVFYALPRTVIKTDVPVVRTEKKPGEFAEFAPCFFPNDDPIESPSKTFSIKADQVKFDTTFVPDAGEVYMIKTTGGMFETRNLELTLTESGVFVKGTADVTNESIDIVTGTVKTGVGLIAKASTAGLLGLTDELPEDVAAAAFRKQRATCQETLVRKAEALRGDAAKAGVRNAAELNGRAANYKKTAGELQDGPSKSPNPTSQPSPTPTPTPGTAVTPGPTVSSPTGPCSSASNADTCEKFRRALDLYKQITILQERRGGALDLSSLNATVPADSLKLVLAELDAAIKGLKEGGFLGTEEKLTWNASFRVNPKDLAAGNIYYERPLMKLSKEDGVCAVLVNQGVQVDPRFKAGGSCKAGKEVRLKTALGEDGEGGPDAGALMADKIKAAQFRQSGDRGFYYRVPGRAIAFLVQEGDAAGQEVELGRAPLSIAQYGQVVSLPASTGGRKTKYTLELFESSGGLKNFVMGSSALVQQKNVSDLTDAVGTAIEAKGERNKAKAPADELQQLERQRKILEEKKKIRDLENELNNADEGGASPDQD